MVVGIVPLENPSDIETELLAKTNKKLSVCDLYTCELTKFVSFMS